MKSIVVLDILCLLSILDSELLGLLSIEINPPLPSSCVHISEVTRNHLKSSNLISAIVTIQRKLLDLKLFFEMENRYLKLRIPKFEAQSVYMQKLVLASVKLEIVK